VITRNNPAPALIAKNEEIGVLDEESLPIGLYRGTRPVINELALEEGLTTVVYTDGMVHAGSRYGQSIDVVTGLLALLENEDPSPQFIADSLLENALTLDRGRPSDDISIVVLRVMSRTGDEVRRMTVRLPLDLH
jgi:serine phosphatase RsbU (regulator of sigma subunit)